MKMAMNPSADPGVSRMRTARRRDLKEVGGTDVEPRAPAAPDAAPAPLVSVVIVTHN